MYWSDSRQESRRLPTLIEKPEYIFLKLGRIICDSIYLTGICGSVIYDVFQRGLSLLALPQRNSLDLFGYQ